MIDARQHVDCDPAYLLGRPAAAFDLTAIARYIAGKRVLITGAGGSIGSALAAKICELAPLSVTLLDNSEFNLYTICRHVSALAGKAEKLEALCDVRDARRLGRWFEQAAPDLVIHAAALKHVAMGERHPVEYAHTNVIGTKLVADMCQHHSVGAMVNISTDKVVNARNILGMTKRLAESYCRVLDSSGGRTRFISVRFGNVIGTTGSVIPLFLEQIRQGGPVTVTHPDARRFFMAPAEAVVLVLQAALCGSADDAPRGNTYVLDMGEPIRIADLAERMIRKLVPANAKPVAIEFTGLNPGESVSEELLDPAREAAIAVDKGLLRISGPEPDRAALETQMEQIALAVADMNASRLVALLKLATRMPQMTSSLRA